MNQHQPPLLGRHPAGRAKIVTPRDEFVGVRGGVCEEEQSAQANSKFQLHLGTYLADRGQPCA
jgi:hypothetical protein